MSRHARTAAARRASRAPQAQAVFGGENFECEARPVALRAGAADFRESNPANLGFGRAGFCESTPLETSSAAVISLVFLTPGAPTLIEPASPGGDVSCGTFTCGGPSQMARRTYLCCDW